MAFRHGRNLGAGVHPEQSIQKTRAECPYKFIVLGTTLLDSLVDEHLIHDNVERPHPGV